MSTPSRSSVRSQPNSASQLSRAPQHSSTSRGTALYQAAPPRSQRARAELEPPPHEPLSTSTHWPTEHYQQAHHPPPEALIPTELKINRLALLHQFALGLLSLLLFEAARDQLFSEKLYQRYENQRTGRVIDKGKRGVIYDRFKKELATNERTYIASVQAKEYSQEELKEIYEVFPTLVPNIEEKGLRQLEEAMNEPDKSKRKSYIRLVLHVEAEDYDIIRKRLPAISLSPQYRRVYPTGDYAGPVLGHMSIYSEQLNGLGGIELAYNHELKARQRMWLTDRDGKQNILGIDKDRPEFESETKSLMLTLDTRIQQITESHLKDAVRSADAMGGVAIVMDPNNGDILAMAQAPSYNPNLYNTYQDQSIFSNQAISSVFEPGSTMKPLVVAAAIEERVLEEDSVLPGYNGTYILGPFKVKDTHKVKEQTTLEMIQYSSNIGAIHVGQRLGIPKLYSYLMKFGLGSPTELGLTQEQPGTLANLTKLSPKKAHLNASTWTYGYGLNATPLQMTTAIAAIANGGYLLTPRLVQAFLNEEGEVIERFEPRRRARVVGERAVNVVKKGMVLVTEKGTGLAARVSGYYVAGKSGTTRKYMPKTDEEKAGYKKGAYLATFVGFVPAEAPRVVIYVLINEPKIGPNGGGSVAGPVFSKIAEEILPYLGVSPTRAQSKRGRSDRGEAEQPYTLHIERDYQPWWSKDRFLRGDKDFELVPNLKGKNLQQTLATLRELNATVTFEGSGVVVSQEPEAGEVLRQRHFIVQMERPMIIDHQTPQSAQKSSSESSLEGVFEELEAASQAERGSRDDEGEPPMVLPPAEL